MNFSWVKKNQKEFIILSLIILLAVFLRFYKLDQYMQFLGDQGRDALIVKQIIVDRNLVAIGPPSSVGTVYLGSLYYYMMAVAMFIFWLNPVAAAGMVALFGVLTVLLIYYLTRQWFGQSAALTAAFLYSLSPVAINYSRFSWNPNPAPFFTLLAFLGLFKVHRSGNFRWLILTGIALGAVIQMHYLALILLPIFGILWIYELSLIQNGRVERKFFSQGTLFAVLLFLLLQVPLILFDFVHNFLNFHGLINLFFGEGSGIGLSLVDSFTKLPDTYINNLVGRYIGGQNQILSFLISILVLIPLGYGFWPKKNKNSLYWPILALTIWLFLGLFGLMFYKGEIFDHYLAFLSPIPFILFGALVELGQKTIQIKKMKFVFLLTAVSITLVLAFYNLLLNPILKLPNQQLQKTQQIAQFIIDESENKPFNFALIAENNYDAAYQFYLEQYGQKPKVVPDEKTGQLFVVCEDIICNPVGHSKYEIAAFGWAKLEWEKEVGGTKVFKLISNPDQPK